MKFLILIFIFGLMETSCISVSFKPSAQTTLKKLSYQPPSDFIKLSDIELGYQNPKSGYIIFVESLCPSDQEQFVTDLIQTLKSPRLINLSQLPSHSQPAQLWHYMGQKQHQTFNLWIAHWEMHHCAVYVTLMAQQHEVMPMPTDFINSLNSVKVDP